MTTAALDTAGGATNVACVACVACAAGAGGVTDRPHPTENARTTADDAKLDCMVRAYANPGR